MTEKNLTPRKGRGKADAQRAADELTAERIRAILSDPKTGERVTLKLTGLLNKLGSATDAPVLESPDFFAHTFAHGSAALLAGDVPRFEVKEAREAAAEIARLAERHEPKAFRVARRCAEIWEAAEGEGANYFVAHVDAVLDCNDGLVPNPDSTYFEPLFVEAFNASGPRDRDVRRLLDLIKRVDAGADLNALAEEDNRRWEERAEKGRPKDARLVDALSAVLADPKREDEHRAILVTLNDLSNTTGANDLHPEIFPTLARVVIREAREYARGRSESARRVGRYLRGLEMLAG